MNDQNHTITDAESAEALNPIIGNIPADTFQNISNILALSQDLLAGGGDQSLSNPGKEGLFTLFGCIKAATDYEIENFCSRNSTTEEQ